MSPGQDVGRIHVHREINVLSASAIMTGVIIGSGIFVSPISFVQNCGSVAMSLVMWIVSAILTLLVALCFNELGSMFPKSGGEYVFIRESLGPLVGFVNVWQHFVLIQPSFLALLGLTAADYLVQTFKPENCDVPKVAIKLITIAVIVVMVVINCVYVRYVARLQNVLSALKILALTIITITGAIQLYQGRVEYLQLGFEGTHTDIGAYAIAIHTGLFTYMGWQYIFCIMEEVKTPSRTVPLATVISLTTVTVLYTMTNVAYFTVMSPQEMMVSKAVAVTFAERTLGRFSVVVPLLVAISTIGALNGAVLTGSRYYGAAAQDGLFPSVMSTIHVQYRTPWASLFIGTVFTVLYVIAGDTVALVEYNGFGMTMMMFTTIVSMLYLRWTRSHLHRPIKIHICVPIICFAVLLWLIVMGIYYKPYQNGIGALLVGSGVPVYLIFVVAMRGWDKWRTRMYRYTCVIQKTLKSVPPDKEL